MWMKFRNSLGSVWNVNPMGEKERLVEVHTQLDE